MCNCKISCNLVAVVAGLVIGIVTAFLQITAVITVTPVFLWVVFGIAVAYLALALATTSCGSCPALCGGGCSSLSFLLVGALGTALLAGVLLAIPFAATSVIGAILLGTLLFFFSLTLISTACLIRARCGD